jgi:hypothetical protein
MNAKPRAVLLDAIVPLDADGDLVSHAKNGGRASRQTDRCG